MREKKRNYCSPKRDVKRRVCGRVFATKKKNRNSEKLYDENEKYAISGERSKLHTWRGTRTVTMRRGYWVLSCIRFVTRGRWICYLCAFYGHLLGWTGGILECGLLFFFSSMFANMLKNPYVLLVRLASLTLHLLFNALLNLETILTSLYY